MRRTTSLLTGLALAAGLCLSTVAVPTAPAASGDAAASRAQHAEPPVRRTVRYGAKAVRVPAHRAALVSFRGHRGDLVSLDDTRPGRVTLHRGDHRVRPRWTTGPMWRLPRTGRYTFRTQASRKRHELTLMKARLHDLPVDGDGLYVRKQRRGVLDLAVLHLGEAARVTVDDGRFDKQVFYRGHASDLLYGDHLMLRPGAAARTDDGGSGDVRVRAGRVLVRVAAQHRVTATSAVTVPVTVDGAPVTLTGRSVAAREYVLGFTGSAEELVWIDGLGDALYTSTIASTNAVVDRFGDPVPSTEVPGDFLLPTSGTHELSVVSDQIGDTHDASVRLRRGVRVGDLVPDGAPVTFTFDGSGDHLYSLAAGPGRTLTGTPSGLDAAERWRVAMGPRQVPGCAPQPNPPLGCGEHDRVEIWDASLANSSSYSAMAADAVAVARVAPGTTGSLQVRLTTAAQP